MLGAMEDSALWDIDQRLLTERDSALLTEREPPLPSLISASGPRSQAGHADESGEAGGAGVGPQGVEGAEERHLYSLDDPPEPPPIQWSPSPSLQSTEPGLPVVRASGGRKPRRHRVWLNVYDIDAATTHLNEHLLKLNLGAFHCGVEVLGDEWFFAWGESDYTGVMWTEPRSHRVHVYRESLCMGESGLSEQDIRNVLGDIMDEWLASSYHPITRNCVSFAEALVTALKVPEPFPPWVRGAMDAGKSPMVLPLGDCAWTWVRWYCSQPDQAHHN